MSSRPSPEHPLLAEDATREALLNLALDINLEWGPELSRPQDLRMQERTRGVDHARFPELLAEAGKAASLANGIVYDGWDDGKNADGLTEQARAAVAAAHPWVDADNMAHMLSQACYYAWHG